MIEQGDKISIKGLQYDVLTVLEEPDNFYEEKKEKQGWHTQIELKAEDSQGWAPSHRLKMYLNEKKICFGELIHKKEKTPTLSNTKKPIIYTKYEELDDNIKNKDIKIL